MPLKKVAPTTQWPTNRRGKPPTRLQLVDSGLGYWTIQAGTADAHFTDSGSGYLIVNTSATSGKKISKIGSLPPLRIT